MLRYLSHLSYESNIKPFTSIYRQLTVWGYENPVSLFKQRILLALLEESRVSFETMKT